MIKAIFQNFKHLSSALESPKIFERVPAIDAITPSTIVTKPNLINDFKNSDINALINKTQNQSHRRTDEQVRSRPLSWPRDSASASDIHHASLRSAASYINVPGVYILRLGGQVMKVGSAEIGIQKRMQQYYGLNKSCGLPEINESNREKIQVTWQDCPVCKCNELESKLARKYGLGPWAKRAPHSKDDSWELLI